MLDEPFIEQAALQLLKGELVAFPTETVYGLGADAENTMALEKVFAIKGRPSNHPLIVHLPPKANVLYWAQEISPVATKLMNAFWPGPLTLIFKRNAYIPAQVSGGHDTIGLRCPSHPVAQALLQHFAMLKPGGNGGVAAPSANRFGQVSPTQAEHVRAEFEGIKSCQLMILDGGAAEVGIESTILDVSDASAIPTLLRPGHISKEKIAEVLGYMPRMPQIDSPQVSGSLKAHYAPRTPLKILPHNDMRNFLKHYDNNETEGKKIALVLFSDKSLKAPSGVQVFQCASQSDQYASELYSRLRYLDAQGFDLLIFEQPPHKPQWVAVNDRLGRAAAAFID